MVEFAGFELPVQYTGVIQETLAVRQAAGMFDVSHMARLLFSGSGSLEYLEFVTTNDVAKLEVGTGHYSLIPNANGGIIDDIILYRIGKDEYKMVVNAANHQKDVAHFLATKPESVTLNDYTSETAMIAVQGPKSTEILAAVSSDPNWMHSTTLFGCKEVEIGGVQCFAARSGYTGEDGFELQCRSQDSAKLWKFLLEAGVVPCGLGSRDTLRVEAGLPLYGHELNDELSPIASGLGWVVSKTKSFMGCNFVNQSRVEGTEVKLHGIVLESKRVPAPGMNVMADGQVVGTVSSGVYSPVLERGIAFAFLNPGIKIGTPCQIDIRGTWMPGVVTGKRFLKSS